MRTPGHRDLTPAEVAAIEDIRRAGAGLDLLCSNLSSIADPRWAAIAKTDLQKGIMSLVRAVTKPEFF